MTPINVEWLEVHDVKWAAFVDQIESDVYHLASYTDATEVQQGNEAGAVFIESPIGAMLVPLVLRQIPASGAQRTLRDAISPYGYPGPVLSRMTGDERAEFLAAAFPAMSDFLYERGIVSAFVRLHPFLGLESSEARQLGSIIHHGETALVELGKTEDQLWTETRKGHRYEIRRALRQGNVASFDPEMRHFDNFKEIYRESMGRVGASDAYYFDDGYFNALRDKLGERLKLWVVEFGGEITAASLFTEYRGVVQYHLSGTRTEHLVQQPTKLLLHEVRLWAKARGNRVMHLGGGLGGRSDSLFKFKAGFSPTHCPFHTWRIIADQEAYDQLVMRHLGDVAARVPSNGFFPAYRMPVTD